MNPKKPDNFLTITILENNFDKKLLLKYGDIAFQDLKIIEDFQDYLTYVNDSYIRLHTII